MGFDCGDPGLNAALEKRIPAAIQEGRVRLIGLSAGDGRLIACIALRAAQLEVDSIDRSNVIPHLTHRIVPTMHIELLAVHKDWHGRNLGTQLLDIATDTARQVSEQIGLRFITLDATPSSVAFYEKHFFQAATFQPGRESGLLLGADDTTSMLLDLMA